MSSQSGAQGNELGDELTATVRDVEVTVFIGRLLVLRGLCRLACYTIVRLIAFLVEAAGAGFKILRHLRIASAYMQQF